MEIQVRIREVGWDTSWEPPWWQGPNPRCSRAAEREAVPVRERPAPMTLMVVPGMGLEGSLPMVVVLKVEVGKSDVSSDFSTLDQASRTACSPEVQNMAQR